jgi:thiopeptide-type bacteriocin biosynthesis protein
MTKPVTPGTEATAVDAASYAVDRFVLRTPLLPALRFVDLVSGLSDVDWETPDDFARGVGVIRERLRSFVNDPDIIEALFIASPALVDGLKAWRDDPLGKRGQRAERSLVKYLARMSTRPTPFGLFSGCSTGQMAERTVLRLGSRSELARHSRLDMDYLFALTETLNRGLGFRDRLRFRPNDTLVALGDRYRYVEPRVGDGNVRRYHLVSIERTPHLDHVLTAFSAGAPLDELVAGLTAFDAEIEVDEVRAYVNELIDNHVLVSTLQPPVTGREPAGEIASQLRAVGADDMADRLDAATALLERLDATGIGHPPADYTAVLETLQPLPAPVEISRLVQVDMRKPGEITLGPEVRVEIERCARMLARFGAVSDPLAGFRSAFDKRYGTAAMPLLQVLDEESGIGLGDVAPADQSPLIAGFPVARVDTQDATWKPRHSWLLDRLHAAWSDGSTEIVVTDDEMQLAFGSPGPPPVGAFSVGFSLIASSADAVDRGDFLVEYRNAVGPSGARILGRFCHVDRDVAEIVGQHLREEEAQDSEAVFAEIVHLPQGRLGNVILRPVMRGYELTYLGRSGAAEPYQIPLSDVCVSVRGDRVVLWSATLAKRIVPRLTNAHNFTQPGTLAPYRFLASLQTDGRRSSFSWDWGPLANAAYLPRVRFGRCVLSRAAWRATAEELKPLAKLAGRDRFSEARAWARKRRIPRLVELVDGDNELLVDFDNPLSLDAFIDLVDERPRVRLSEMLPDPSQLCVSNDEGRFTHEIFVPVVRHQATPSLPSQSDPSQYGQGIRPASGRRNIAPGAEWMFAKIYAGAAEADRVLSTIVAPLVHDVCADGVVDRWYFIRYGDPDFHVRLRFRGRAEALHGDVLVRLTHALEPWLASGNVSRLQLDTYQPEVERYGGDVGLDLSEQIFEADSEAVLSVLCELEGDRGAEARWQLALRGLEALVDDFGFSAREKRDIIARRRRDYGVEFNVDATPLRHALGDRFRQYRGVLQTLMDREHDAASELAPGFAIWQRRSAKLQPLVAQLRAAERDGRLGVPVTTLGDSYLHMFVNRLARAHGRTHELVMFDLLERHLESLDARARRNSSPGRPKKAAAVVAV